MVNPLKVAIPCTAGWVKMPAKVPLGLFEPSVIETVVAVFVMMLPLPSSIATLTVGSSSDAAVVDDGELRNIRVVRVGGTGETVALADAYRSAALVALTSTFWAVEMDVGAV
jgi:hypothetical protein